MSEVLTMFHQTKEDNASCPYSRQFCVFYQFVVGTSPKGICLESANPSLLSNLIRHALICVPDELFNTYSLTCDECATSRKNKFQLGFFCGCTLLLETSNTPRVYCRSFFKSFQYLLRSCRLFEKA